MEQQAVALVRVKVGGIGYPGCFFAFIFCTCVLLYFCISKVMEEELAALAELRMKEESATELSVRMFINS